MKSSPGPFRFAFISTMNGCPWGGSEELWSRTALRLAEQGHVVHVSVLKWPTRPEPLKELAAAGVSVVYRPRGSNAVDRAMTRLFHSDLPVGLRAADVRWLQSTAADLAVISQGGPWDGVPWMLGCRRLGIRYCPIVHANSEIWWPTDDELDAFRTGYQDARLAFFVSQGNRRLFEAQCGMRLERSEVVSNPLNLQSRSGVAWPRDEEPTQLACVGRLEPRAKGQDLIFQVLAQSKWRQVPLRLNLYGTGNGEQSLRRLAEMLKLDNVRFHGQVPDLSRIWADNHALVLPSRFEGLPLCILEAMMCGRPVITTDVAGNAEVVRDEINGFVAAAPSIGLLDDTLERAWSRRLEWEEMGRRAREDALRAVPEDAVGDFVNKLLGLSGASDLEASTETRAAAEPAQTEHPAIS